MVPIFRFGNIELDYEYNKKTNILYLVSYIGLNMTIFAYLSMFKLKL